MVKDIIIRNDLIKRLSSELGVVEAEVITRFEDLRPKRRYVDKINKDDEPTIRHYDSKSDKAQLEILKLLIHNSSLANKITLIIR